MNISTEKLKKFISDNSESEISNTEVLKQVMRIKLSILKEAEKALNTAIKEKDSTMVASIAEILKSY